LNVTYSITKARSLKSTGNPDPRIKETIEWEHTKSNYAAKSFWCWWRGNTTACEEYDYVVNQKAKETDTKGMAGQDNSGKDITNGVRDKGRDGWNLQHFWNENIVMIEQAGLLMEEVIVLRLYTGKSTHKTKRGLCLLILASCLFFQARCIFGTTICFAIVG
jgi:hypothetical protein